MIEFDSTKMSEEDLINAANEIFSSQEKDFEKIKSEKWYQTLFHSITLNQDGKKIAVRGISNLAKLQQLFMDIYVKNYKNTHEQLNTVIDRVQNNSIAIKQLYDCCVRNLKKQEELDELDSQDAEILALFLCEYKDENGEVPEEIKEYNRNVLLALNQKLPSGTLDNHLISKLKAPGVAYRCFMEQCVISETIDSENWCDAIYSLLDDFELSTNSRRKIKEEVKKEAESFGKGYFLLKYTQNNQGGIEKELEIDEMISQKSVDRINESEKEASQEELSDENISTILQIRDGETKEYKYKNIHISAYIRCEGLLVFDHCVIFYHEDGMTDEITLSKGGSLTIKDSVIVCCGYAKKYFIYCDDKKHEVTIENTSLIDCSYMLGTNSNVGIKLRINRCEFKNCYENVIYFFISREQNHCEITNSCIMQNKISSFNAKGATYSDIKLFNFTMCKDIIIHNNQIIEDRIFKKSLPKDTNFQFFSLATKISNCTFIGVSNPIRAQGIYECKFENCYNIIRTERRFPEAEYDTYFIDNCVFKECSDIIKVYNYTKITNCQFVSCYNRLINAHSAPVQIEYCHFTNIINDLYEKNIMMLPSISCIELSNNDLKGYKNKIEKCVFSGIKIEKPFLIAVDCYKKPSGITSYISNCDFMNCSTVRDDGKLINGDAHYYGMFNKMKYVNSCDINNCKGLDRVNMEGNRSCNYNIRTVSTGGEVIGSSIIYAELEKIGAWKIMKNRS